MLQENKQQSRISNKLTTLLVTPRDFPPNKGKVIISQNDFNDMQYQHDACLN